jgi:hypothetical protein
VALGLVAFPLILVQFAGVAHAASSRRSARPLQFILHGLPHHSISSSRIILLSVVRQRIVVESAVFGPIAAERSPSGLVALMITVLRRFLQLSTGIALGSLALSVAAAPCGRHILAVNSSRSADAGDLPGYLLASARAGDLSHREPLRSSTLVVVEYARDREHVHDSCPPVGRRV